MKIMLLGKNGQVGWELQRTLAPLGQVIALGRQELNLTDEQAIRRLIRGTSPDLVVNAAAYTAVDKAEEEPELAMAINGTAPGILAEEAAARKALLVHYSTDYIFDGTKGEPYNEEDQPCPINVYGETKLAGEEAIRNKHENHLILRTSWVYGLHGKNFLLTMQKLAREKDELRVVADQFGCPTWSRMIAEATAQLLARGRNNRELPRCTYNLCADGHTSWHDFAREIFARLYPSGDVPVRLSAISTSEYKTAAPRPSCSALNCDKIGKEQSIFLPGWQNILDLALAR